MMSHDAIFSNMMSHDAIFRNMGISTEEVQEHVPESAARAPPTPDDVIQVTQVTKIFYDVIGYGSLS